MSEQSIEQQVREIIKEMVHNLGPHIFGVIAASILLLVLLFGAMEENNMLWIAISTMFGVGFLALAVIGFTKALEQVISTVVIVDMTDDRTAYERLIKIDEELDDVRESLNSDSGDSGPRIMDYEQGETTQFPDYDY